MKKLLVLLSVFLLGFAGITSAATINFEDKIDNWCGVDAIPIVEGLPISYTHDINDDVNIVAGDVVTFASLELDFTNDLLDTVFTGWFKGLPDLTEYVSYGFDGNNWISIGEVDNGQYLIGVDVSLLNTDGKLNVVLSVTNNDNGLGTAYLDHSRLYGTAETAPVPEPTTILLLGSGLMGLASIKRKFKRP